MQHVFTRFTLISSLLLLAACTATTENALTTEETSSEPPYQHYDLEPECFVSEDEYAQYDLPSAPDIWSRVRDGYLLPEQTNKRIDAELRWYKRHPSYIQRVTKRGAPYIYHIVEELTKRNMPLEIALLPIVESAFDPFAYSHGRASGMWQFVPATGRSYGMKQNWWYDGRRDIIASTEGALDYLQHLHKRFDGDWLLALASYNSGAGKVSRAIRKNKKKGKGTDFWQLSLPKETRDYVPRLIALSKLFADPQGHNVSLHSVPNAPYFAQVPTGTQIDLAQAAELAGLSMDQMYLLNPGFNRWATDPEGPHRLLIPLDKAKDFEEKITAIPEDERVTWQRYTIKSGDVLSTIAQRYGISVKSLKSINKIRGSNIRAGKTLMVPVAAKGGKHYSYSVDQRVAKRYAAVDKKQKGKKINYVVKRGDSLWTISRRFNVGVRSLAKWNSMAPRDPIKPGQKLKIWTNTSSKALKTASISNTDIGNANGVIRKLSYKVRSGDSLARIAKKFRVRISDIVKWNQIQASKYLQPGQSLTLFVDVTKS